ncbi:MAG TPA: hypothetical protein VNM90_28810 [Haliangium sp.]|nr:hypothetical protein [Haliangium sp.]
MKRLAIFLVLLGSACGPDDDGMPMVTPPPAACEGDAPAPESLQWKRISALENDLMSALDLAREEVCNELGLYRCALVHLVPLGSANPFGASLYEAVAEPLATTPAAVDRIVLAACIGRVQRDRQAAPQVFTHFPLEGQAPAAGAPEIAAMIQDLYRRFLQRDPTAEEIAMVSELAVDDAGAPVAAADFAKLACFTIGTTTEFLFF